MGTVIPHCIFNLLKSNKLIDASPGVFLWLNNLPTTAPKAQIVMQTPECDKQQRVTCKMSWTTGRSDLHARAGYEWCTTQPFITRHAGTATRRKT